MFDDLTQFTGFNLWGEDEPELNPTTEKEPGTKDVITTEGTVIETTTSQVGKLESKDPEQAFFDEVSDLVMPRTRPQKQERANPCVVLIEDDFSTLDLMKIYLQRSYDFLSFDNAREAIFYLNKHVPDLIFLDCYISIVSAKKLLEIIRAYEEYADVPIYLLAEADEIGAMKAKIEQEDFPKVQGILTRPVARGELQAVLDTVFPTAATS